MILFLVQFQLKLWTTNTEIKYPATFVSHTRQRKTVCARCFHVEIRNFNWSNEKFLSSSQQKDYRSSGEKWQVPPVAWPVHTQFSIPFILHAFLACKNTLALLPVGMNNIILHTFIRFLSCLYWRPLTNKKLTSKSFKCFIWCLLFWANRLLIPLHYFILFGIQKKVNRLEEEWNSKLASWKNRLPLLKRKSINIYIFRKSMGKVYIYLQNQTFSIWNLRQWFRRLCKILTSTNVKFSDWVKCAQSLCKIERERAVF